jgi:dipeptidyl aminopeptidase/acylaminoacyl peptidase
MTRYGFWEPPLLAADIAGAGALRLAEPRWDGGDLYWLEGRPAEGGRVALLRWREDHGIEDLLPAPHSVRSKVHEYGGGAYAVAAGRVWFCDAATQRIMVREAGGEIRPLTPPGADRHADLTPDVARGWLYAVRERHTPGAAPRNALVAVALDGGAVRVLASGHDFYASPRLSPCGRWLCWLAWDQPRMPWDGTRLYRARLTAEGVLEAVHCVAGQGDDRSLFQPEFRADGALEVVSDHEGWWNLYRVSDSGLARVLGGAFEMGLPQWQFGMRTRGRDASGVLTAAACELGRWRLLRQTPEGTSSRALPLPFSSIEAVSVAAHGAVALIAATPDSPPALWVLHPDGRLQGLRHSLPDLLDAASISAAQPLQLDAGGGESCHAFYYAPRLAGHAGLAGEKPPLIVTAHGGPTGMAGAGFEARVQYWTARGFAWLDVNYRGSTGFGRAYRERLRGQWGVLDAQDCVAAARACAAQGLADGARLFIRGSSAGGYTVLCALAFHGGFAAGASYYGIGDLAALAAHTHKFEARYLDALVAPWPQGRAVYAARSPLVHAARINCPVIFFQGVEDAVVPPEQSRTMQAALVARGLACPLHEFAGEGHGFRQAATLCACLEAELDFYRAALRGA